MSWTKPLKFVPPPVLPSKPKSKNRVRRPILVHGKTYPSMSVARDETQHSTTKLYAMVDRGEAHFLEEKQK